MEATDLTRHCPIYTEPSPPTPTPGTTGPVDHGVDVWMERLRQMREGINAYLTNLMQTFTDEKDQDDESSVGSSDSGDSE